MIAPATLPPSIIKEEDDGQFRTREGLAGARGAMAGQWFVGKRQRSTVLS